MPHTNPIERQRYSRDYYTANRTLRDERREQTRQAVWELLTQRSVKQMVQVAFEANGRKGDAGARVL